MALQKLILVHSTGSLPKQISRTRYCEYKVQIPRGKINFPTVHKCLDLNDNFGLPMPHHKLVVNHLCLVHRCSTPVGFLTVQCVTIENQQSPFYVVNGVNLTGKNSNKYHASPLNSQYVC